MRKFIIGIFIIISFFQLFSHRIAEWIDIVSEDNLESIAFYDCPAPAAAVHFDFDDCNAILNNTNMDYSEFTPTYADFISCAEFNIVGGFLYRRNPLINVHSCTPGVDNSVAMCVSGLDECGFQDNSDLAIRFTVNVKPTGNEPADLSGIRFFERSPDEFQWNNGPSGPNNYPTLFGLRILKNGLEVFKQIDIPTNLDWTLQEFDLSDNSAFIVDTESVFEFELLGYCLIGNGEPVAAWDIDELSILTCCGDCEGITNDDSDFLLEVGECSGALVELNLTDQTSVISPDLNPISWEWTIDNGGEISTLSGPVVSTAIDNVQTSISLLVTLYNGCTIMVDKEYIQGFLPQVTADASIFTCGEDQYFLSLESSAIDDDFGSSLEEVTWDVTTQNTQTTETGENINVQLSEIDGLQISVTYTYENGCSVVVEVDTDFITNTELELIINPVISECLSSQFEITFENSFDFMGMVSIESYNWTLIQNGVETTSDLETITTIFNEDDIVEVYSEIVLSNSCTLTDTLIFDPTQVIPTIEIEKTVLGCDGDNIEFTVGLNTDELPDIYTIVDTDWTVTIDNVSMPIFADPFTVSLTDGQQLLIFVSVTLDNGCIIELTELCNATDVSPEAEFTYTIENCQPINEIYNATFATVSVGATSSWIVVINGVSSEFTGDEFSIEIPLNANVEISLNQDFGNGCTSNVTEDLSPFNPTPEIEILFSINNCSPEVNLEISSNVIGNSDLAIDSYEWTIIDGDNVTTFATETVMYELVEGANVFLQVFFENGCLSENVRTIVAEDIVPSIITESVLFSCGPNSVLLQLGSSLSSDFPGAQITDITWFVNGTALPDNVQGANIEIELPTLQNIDISVVYDFDNGCQLSETIDLDGLEETELTVTINPSLVSCNGDAYAVLFENELNYTGNSTSIEYNWIVDLNGVISNFTTETILVDYSEGDILNVSSTITIGADCVAKDELLFNLEDVLPLLGISVSAISCSEESVIFEVSLDESNLMPQFEISSKVWTVLINGIPVPVGDDPFNLTAGLADIVEIEVDVSFANGCSIIISDSFTGNDALPNIDIVYSINDCTSDIVDFTIQSDASNGEITQAEWTIIIDGVQSMLSGSDIQLEVASGSSLDVTVDVVFENGCTATDNLIVDSFDPNPEINFEVNIESCENNEVEVTLSPILDSNNPSANPISYTWTVVNGPNTNTFNTEIVNILLENEDTEITLDIIFDNGCSSSVNQFFEGGVLPVLTIKGEATRCNENAFQIEAFACVTPDNVIVNVGDLNWIVNTVDGEFTFTGDTIRFEVSDLMGLEGIVSTTTEEGCDISGEFDGGFSISIPSLTIESIAGQCVDSEFTIELYNVISTGAGINPEAYNWTVDLNGVITNFNTDTISLIVSSDDILNVTSEVTLIGNCVLEASTEIFIDDLLPQSEIVVDVVACPDPESIDIQISSMDNIPSSLILISEEWIVDVNGVVTTFTAAPIDLSILLTDSITITHILNFDEGCSLTVIESFLGEDILPEANFTFSVSDCNPANDIYQVEFETTAVNAMSTWIILVDGIESNFTGPLVNIDIPSDAMVVVTLSEEYANGCTASVTQTFDPFDPTPEVSFVIDVALCANNQVLVNLIPTIDSGGQTLTVVSYDWNINNDGTISMFDTETVSILLNDAPTEIVLEVLFSNGCVGSFTQTLDNGILPELELKGTAANCNLFTYQVEYTICYPDSLIDLSINNVEWTINTVDGVITLNGETVQFEVSSLMDISASVIATTTEGCTLTGESVDDITEVEPGVEIGFELGSCVDSLFNLEIYNVLNNTNGLNPDSFNWTVDLDGVVTNYNTDTILINVSQGSTLSVTTEVTLMGGCVVTQSMLIDLEEVLPQSEIVIDLLACPNPESVDIQITSNDDIPSTLVVDSEEWFVEINGVETSYPSAPIDLTVLLTDSITITHILNFEGGCSLTIIESYLGEDFLPEAIFTYVVSDCDPESDIYQVQFETTAVNAMSTWVIVVNGVETTFTGSVVDIDIPVDAMVVVTLMEEYTNGCSASTTEEYDPFDPNPDVSFVVDVALCANGQVLVNLIPTVDTGGQSVTVVSYDWTINNDGTISTFDTETVSILLVDGPTEIVLEVVFSNGCVGSFTQTLENGVLPELELKGTAANCGSTSFQVEYTICYPDSLIDLSINNVDWTINTVDGVLMLNGETVQFEVSSLMDISASVIATTTEGCTLTGESFDDIVEVEPSVEIGFELGSCVDSLFNLEIYNLLNNTNGLNPDLYNWTVELDGVITNFSTDTILVSVGQGDTLLVSTEVTLMGGCVVTADTIIVVDEFLPQSDITVDLIGCPNSFSVEVEINSVDSIPDDLVVLSEEWIVDIDGVITNFDSAPFNLILLITSDVCITHIINFENGCSIEVKELINVDELIPDATFIIEGVECDIDSNQVTINIINTTVIEGAEIESIQWFIVIDGENFFFDTDTVQITVVNGTLVTISHMVTFDNGCTATGINAMTIEIPSIEFTNNPLIVCGPDEIPLVSNPNPNWEYTWDPIDGLVFLNGDPSNPVAVVDENTTFYVTVTNGICEIMDSVNVIVSIEDTLVVTQSDDNCDGTYVLSVENAEPGIDYIWSTDEDFIDIVGNGSMIEVSVADTFYVQFETMDTCITGQGQIIVTDEFLLDFTATNPMMFCEGDTMIYTIVNNADGQMMEVIWTDDPHILSDLDSAEIMVTIFEGEDQFELTANVSNEFGCDSLITITFMAGVINNLGFTFDYDCESLLVCFTQNADFVGSVIWDFGDPTTELDQTTDINPCYTYPTVGDYIVTLTPNNPSCNPDPLEVPITIIDTISVMIGAELDTIFQTKDLELFVIDPQPGYMYEWSTGETTSSITVSPEETTIFSVTVTDERGCTGIDQFEVTVLPIQCNEDGIYIPNAFSPNGDGVNDILFVRSNCLESIDFVIFNRWGEEIFRTTDPLAGWDGRFANKELAPDAYGYQLRAVCATGEIYTTQGNVSIIR